MLENDVLDCIGELAPDQQDLARTMVQGVWGGGDDWRATDRSRLQRPPDMDESSRSMWLRSQAKARQRQQSLHPVQFAKMIVAQNFASLIG